MSFSHSQRMFSSWDCTALHVGCGSSCHAVPNGLSVKLEIHPGFGEIVGVGSARIIIHHSRRGVAPFVCRLVRIVTVSKQLSFEIAFLILLPSIGILLVGIVLGLVVIAQRLQYTAARRLKGVSCRLEGVSRLWERREGISWLLEWLACLLEVIARWLEGISWVMEDACLLKHIASGLNDLTRLLEYDTGSRLMELRNIFLKSLCFGVVTCLSRGCLQIPHWFVAQSLGITVVLLGFFSNPTLHSFDKWKDHEESIWTDSHL